MNAVESLAAEVLFIGDVAKLLGLSVRTIERKLAAGTFPIPCLASVDRRHRWSVAAVRRYLDGQTEVRRFRRVG